MVTAEQSEVSTLRDLPKIEYGHCVPKRTTVSMGSKLIVASYNIRYGVGQFLIASGLLRKAGFNLPRHRAEKVGENIREAARAFSDGFRLPPVDILALQEADKETTRAGGHHIARELAEELNMSWIHVPVGIPRGEKPKPRQWWLDFEEQIGLYDTGDTGVGLLSHLPIENVERIDLPWQECAWRPRLAVGATVMVGPERLSIFNAHVDPHAAVDGQLDQLEPILEHAENATGPTLILGDFNTLSRKKCLETRRYFESRGFKSPIPTGTPTWRGAGIRLHADWIFARDVTITRWGVARPLNVSDHWPVWAEIFLPKAN
jgi:endonuclease/exonuclease/phosphatase family metal-dependent hydrolase